MGLFSKRKKRALLKDVVPGQRIRIEWDRMTSKIGFVTCVNNDPKTKRMIIKVEWGNYERAGCEQYEERIWEYKDDNFKNFHLLNELIINKPIVAEEDEQEQSNKPVVL
jgi:hypothetical protein